MSVKQKDIQTILEFNGIVRNYVKMNRIESRVELNEEIKNLQSEKDDLENQVYKLEQELEKMREYYDA